DGALTPPRRGLCPHPDRGERVPSPYSPPHAGAPPSFAGAKILQTAGAKILQTAGAKILQTAGARILCRTPPGGNPFPRIAPMRGRPSCARRPACACAQHGAPHRFSGGAHESWTQRPASPTPTSIDEFASPTSEDGRPARAPLPLRLLQAALGPQRRCRRLVRRRLGRARLRLL